jgi:hypothetical protein
MASMPAFGRPPWAILDLWQARYVARRFEREQDAQAEVARREGDWQPGRYRVAYLP